jgi:hypothetical protein
MVPVPVPYGRLEYVTFLRNLKSQILGRGGRVKPQKQQGYQLHSTTDAFGGV